MNNKTIKEPYQVVTITGGNAAISYLKENGKVPAIVDLGALQRIIRGLKSEHLSDIQQAFADRMLSTTSMGSYTRVLADELAFHTLIRRVEDTNFEAAHEDIARAEEFDKEKEADLAV